MTHSIQYLNRVDIIREDRKPILNCLVRSFWKSRVIDEHSYDDLDCQITKELFLELNQEEIEERKRNGETRLTKIVLVECLPEDADYVFVSTTFSRIVAISDISNVRKDEIYTDEDLQTAFDEKAVIVSHPHISCQAITKWI